MVSEDIYFENLELWSCSCPKEAVWLQYFECKETVVVKAASGLGNLKRKGEKESFYDEKDPLKEAEEWEKSLNLKGVEVLYVYGIGLGYYYKPLQKWLKKSLDHQVVFLEDELEVLARFFETTEAKEVLSDSQVSLFYFKQLGDAASFFNQIFWDFPMAKFTFAALKHYERTKGERYQEICRQIAYNAAVKNTLLEEYLQYGAVFYRNFYKNMLHINKSFLGNALFGKFSSTPAIICGAGPSLQKNLPLLKKLQNKALIFAGSSALNALSNAGIQPHLGAGIDPNQMQEERLKNVQNLNYPFFYRNRLYSGALDLIKGPKLYITGSGGFEISEWFEEKFGIEGCFIEEGRNVVNFCLEIAHKMGCSPIIFVGMDLSFTEEKTYAEGVVEDATFTKEAFEAKKGSNEGLVVRKDIFGKDVLTVWKWVSEAEWIGDFAKENPDVCVLNATEGGIGFPGVPNQSLLEVSKNFLVKEYAFQTSIKALYETASLSKITDEKIFSAYDELKKGLEKCLQSLSVLQEENEKVKEEIKKTGDTERLQTGLSVMTETELIEEEAFIFVLQIFNDVASKLMQRDLMKLYNPHNPASEIEKTLEKLELNRQKYIFLSKVAQVNLKLIEYAQEVEDV